MLALGETIYITRALKNERSVRSHFVVEVRCVERGDFFGTIKYLLKICCTSHSNANRFKIYRPTYHTYNRLKF